MNQKNQKFFLKNPSDQKIVGLITPPETTGPFETLIFAHGFKGFKEQAYLEFIAQSLAQKGIGAIRFDFTNGIGESEGDIFYVSAGHYLQDFRTVLNHVKRQSWLKKSALSIGGASFGGMIALLLAAQEPELKSLILQAPVFKPKEMNKNLDLKKWKSQGYLDFHSNSKDLDFKVGYQFYQERLGYDLPQIARRIKAPTLIIHGSKDETIPMSHSQELCRALKTRKKLLLLDGAPHTIKEKKHLRLYNQAITNWLKTSYSL
jgi:pimeloyl-ACP methyl ester carboxylesterase